ncbi:MAG: riboflavin synthase [Lautropia sp.]|nr:MAG: riboflavin synthase [Pseudomonadota bacterium]MBC6960821.1 riboflavin synthase [Lautropia sp.]MCL4703346.1 riboflavin synthase [Burkholderiaceae bacterium]MDL1908914.1 riboflavin synthase [Betaproteobacteria bacterium PRO1]
MFTGIVAAVGRIERVEPLGMDAGVRLTIDAGGLDLSDVTPGDSIAIQGACMTAIGIDNGRFVVEVSKESLSKTSGLDRVGEVNLEKAMRLDDRIGGHLVSGHVDGLGQVVAFEPVGESWRLVLRAPAELAKFFAYKGSVTVNGVSLTVNRVSDVADGAEFEINLIPHTIAVTTLKALKAGDRVNLEVDLIARYVERMLGAPPGVIAAAAHP